MDDWLCGLRQKIAPLLIATAWQHPYRHRQILNYRNFRRDAPFSEIDTSACMDRPPMAMVGERPMQAGDMWYVLCLAKLHQKFRDYVAINVGLELLEGVGK